MDELRNRGSPRLQFSKEELDDPFLADPIARAEKAADKLDKVQKKIRSKQRLILSVEEIDEVPPAGSAVDAPVSAQGEVPLADPGAPGVLNTRRKPTAKAAEKAADTAEQVLKDAETEIKDGVQTAAQGIKKKKVVRLKFEEAKAKPPSRINHPVQKTVRSAGDQLHRQVAKSNEEDNNVAVDAVLRADDIKETALQAGEHAYHAHKLKPYKAAERAERKLDHANIRYLEAKAQSENPQFTSNPVSRWQQKRAIRREYAAAKRGASTGANTAAGAQKTSKAAGKAVEKTGDATTAVAEFFQKHPKALLLIALGAMLLIVMSSLQACTPLAQSVLESIVIGTYPAEEDTVRAAERAYAAKERELKDELDHYQQRHPEYDEVHVKAQEIWHDPYVLIAIISAYYDGQDWDMDKAIPVIEKYFKLQYELTEDVTTETRYRTETTYVYNPETHRNEPAQSQVPYTYKTCNVTLVNKNLSHLPVVSMSHHTMGMYALYMATHGNMEGIFAGNPHATPLKDPMLYDIPQETLDANPTFARLMEEAEKYIGYPYVWGGASPETSFDCSGFVSYVFTNSGVYNTGRLGAKGLRSLCRNVPDDDPQPGDIVFFSGTMGDDVEGITHCGIYVGNNMMIHCGSPIGYANLNDSYWRKHFDSFGRVPH